MDKAEEIRASRTRQIEKQQNSKLVQTLPTSFDVAVVGVSVKVTRPLPRKSCSVCGRAPGGRLWAGYCQAHYKRFRLYGDPNGAADRGPTRTEQLLAWVAASLPRDGCLVADHLTLGRHGYPLAGNQLAPALICAAYHGPRPKGKQAAHSCGNRPCLNPNHLRWATPVENIADKKMHGTQLHGETVPTSKLTLVQVQEIRARLVGGGRTQQSLADEYGVHRITINDIKTNRTWRSD